MSELATSLADAYLDFVNNYLTIAKFAADKGIGSDVARSIITEGQRLHEERVAMAR